jgi:hypothetical protein
MERATVNDWFCRVGHGQTAGSLAFTAVEKRVFDGFK